MDSLPSEIIIQILNYLSQDERHSIIQTSKRFYEIICNFDINTVKLLMMRIQDFMEESIDCTTYATLLLNMNCIYIKDYIYAIDDDNIVMSDIKIDHYQYYEPDHDPYIGYTINKPKFKYGTINYLLSIQEF
jgi:phosphotransferase system IIA component